VAPTGAGVGRCNHELRRERLTTEIYPASILTPLSEPFDVVPFNPLFRPAMKTLTCLLLIFSLASCQKEIQFLKDPKTGQVPKPVSPSTPDPEPEPEPQDTIYRQEPTQVMNIGEFAPMLWGKSEYKITEYYCLTQDLWTELPFWIKDDVYVFGEFGKSWIAGGTEQHPSNSFDTLQRNWKLYGENDEMKFDWVDHDYNAKAYTVVAYKLEESFTLRTFINDSTKVFYTFTFSGKQQ
jgi:hypothetical protein